MILNRTKNRNPTRQLQVTDVSFRPASDADRILGLIGFCEFTLGGDVRVTGVALRRTLRREWKLSFPSRFDGTGKRRYYLRPLTDSARESIENQVIDALRRARIIA